MRKERFTKEISGFRMDEGLREQQRCGAIRNIIKVVGKIQISFVLARKGI